MPSPRETKSRCSLPFRAADAAASEEPGPLAGCDERVGVSLAVMANEIDRVAHPTYLDGLLEEPLEAVRAKRQECQDIENSLSYVRRLLHGRLDIVRGEVERRAGGAEPADLDDIIARLPELLAEGSRSDGLPRPPQDLKPDTMAEGLVDELDAAFPVSVMGAVPEMSSDQLAELADGLANHERTISQGRNQLHDIIDRLQDEIIRRYRSGEANVDSILS